MCKNGYKSCNANEGHQGKNSDQSPCCLKLRNNEGSESRTDFRACCRKATRRCPNSRRKKNWSQCKGRGVRTGIHGEIEENESCNDQPKMHLRPVIRQRREHEHEHPECQSGESPHLQWNSVEARNGPNSHDEA